MKATRKLIPAFIMLLVSAIRLSTASYAWFANSYTVSANGMSVKVNSDAKFLLISDDNTEFDDSVTLEENNTAIVDLVTAIIHLGLFVIKGVFKVISRFIRWIFSK